MPRQNRYSKWLHPRWPSDARAAWTKVVACDDVFARDGLAKNLEPRTLWNLETGFGRFVEFLLAHELWLPTNSLAEQLRPDVLRLYHAHLGETLAPYSCLAQLQAIVGAVRLMEPAADLTEVNKIIHRLQRTARPTRRLDDRLLSPPELVQIGNDLMDEADAAACPEFAQARSYMIGALIQGAALCPLRLRNWRMMRLGEHLLLSDTSALVRFSSAEMKGRRAVEFELPTDYVPRITKYLEQYRPLLLRSGAQDRGYVWLGSDGSITHRNTLPRLVKQTLIKRTGKAFTFHMFRHSAATFVSDVAPERMQVAKGALHHASLSTTQKFYVRGQQRRAFRRYQESVRQILTRAKRRQKAKKRK